MFQDSYVKLDKAQTKDLVEKLKSDFDGSQFDPASTVIMARELPFYKNSKFFDIADHKNMPPARRFVVMLGDQATILDFTNAPIYGLNENAPVALNEKTVIDYARFFFSFVRGRHGRFIIIESVDDIQWREEPPPAARKAIGKMVAPIQLESTENGVYRLGIHMMFKDSLFKSIVDIAPGGQVKILEETLLIEDIPVVDDTLGQ
ncbi:MAG: hypothetical protein DI586_00165 [Micavibrio aeruginosavorus]|uniref:Uncharacterized protein n=1 Tax=Micavibrio aeruginosavorus TaxID=349221 RepID=A0A2W5FSR2_9BACT|nr:MAG: hypothetical protein DI586_00165 [Micavibrio aeruginosavorus]